MEVVTRVSNVSRTYHPRHSGRTGTQSTNIQPAGVVMEDVPNEGDDEDQLEHVEDSTDMSETTGVVDGEREAVADPASVSQVFMVSSSRGFALPKTSTSTHEGKYGYISCWSVFHKHIRNKRQSIANNCTEETSRKHLQAILLLSEA